jgi:hypothetical protein
MGNMTTTNQVKNRMTSYIHTSKAFLKERYGVEVVIGTHPIPQKYLEMHNRLET